MKQIFATLSLISLSCVFCLQSFDANAKEESLFYIEKGSQFELCREIKQILDEPENKTFGVPYIKENMFVVPKKYKNFRFPEWRDVPIKDVSKYISSEKILAQIKNFTKNDKFLTDEGYEMQKSYFDVNHDGNNDEIVRYRVTGDTFHYGNSWDYYVSDDAGAKSLSEEVNRRRGTHGRYKNYKFLWYKGKVFVLNSFSTFRFAIYEPKMVSRTFAIIPTCYMYIDLSRRKHAYEMFKKDRKKMRDKAYKILEQKKSNLTN